MLRNAPRAVALRIAQHWVAIIALLHSAQRAYLSFRAMKPRRIERCACTYRQSSSPARSSSAWCTACSELRMHSGTILHGCRCERGLLHRRLDLREVLRLVLAVPSCDHPRRYGEVLRSSSPHALPVLRGAGRAAGHLTSRQRASVNPASSNRPVTHPATCTLRNAVSNQGRRFSSRPDRAQPVEHASQPTTSHPVKPRSQRKSGNPSEDKSQEFSVLPVKGGTPR